MTTLAPTPVATTPPPPHPVATASGLLAMLNEPDPPLVSHALARLLSCVDTLWHEVAESLPDLEALAEDSELDAKTRRTAAAVASRVFFHLEEPAQALRLALEGGEEHFDVANDRKSSYVECLVSAAVDAYVKGKRKAEEEAGSAPGSDETKEAKAAAADEGGAEAEDEEEAELDQEKLERVVHLMFERCYADGTYNHALGVALEAREADKVREVLDVCCKTASSSVVQSTLKYALDAAVTLVTSKSFRDKALVIVAERLKERFDATGPGEAEHGNAAVSLCRCHQILRNAKAVSDIVSSLLGTEGGTEGEGGEGGGGDDAALLGLQLCFDLVDSGDQGFVNDVAEGLTDKDGGDGAGGLRTSVIDAAARGATASGEVEVSPEGGASAAGAGPGAVEGNVEVVGEEKSTDGGATAAGASEAAGGGATRSEAVRSRFEQALRVLTGGFSSELALSFLHKNSDSDRLIMENLKKALEERGGGGRNSVLHNCAVATHSYLNAGTTNDSFLRDHLDWMRKASNWAKFSATASLGVLHAGHTTEAMTLLEPYLPPSSGADDAAAGADPAAPAVSAAGGYAEGGSLYALGLIHGSHAGSSSAKRKETSNFLRNHLRTSHANEVISHGAALGVGLTAFGSADLEVVNELKELLYTDSAVAGEAAGMAIGLVLVGSGAGNTSSSLPAADSEELLETVSELKNYARETQHEKIIRGIAMGVALINYGQEENADAVVEEMRSDRDPILRYGAQYALALAYCGTGSNKAIRLLLHTAVSDVSDDVRMAAVISLAFVLYKTPERVPQLVKLLLESFNPHVRYASCMAVGIAMAGSGDPESVSLLEPMLEDMTDFVRQGALMGTAMIYMQQSDGCNHKKIKTFRERLTTIVSDKHQSTLTKMGAILSTGIIDAGGRNCSLDLGSRNGFTKMTSAVGLVLWLQHWHWYPMMHMLSLALTPTYTIGLNKDFKYPKNFEIQCNAKPSLFAYPKRLEEKKEEKKKRVETVTLSTTAKNKARLARKRAKEEAEQGGGGPEAMDVDKKEEGASEGKEESKTEEGKSKEEEKEGEGMDVDEEGGDADKKAKKKREPEPTSFRIPNPSRITKSQSDVCTFDLNQRYRPVRPEERPCGVVMLTDSTPEKEEEDLGAVKAPSLEDEDEADAPEPFEWAPPGHPDAEPADDAKAGGEGETKESDAKASGDAAQATE